VASQRVAQAGRLKRQGLSPYARVRLGRCLRSSRLDAAQRSRFAALSIAQRNGQSWISHNRQRRGRLSSAATGIVRPQAVVHMRRQPDVQASAPPRNHPSPRQRRTLLHRPKRSAGCGQVSDRYEPKYGHSILNDFVSQILNGY
jgi:hypothetical protein